MKQLFPILLIILIFTVRQGYAQGHISPKNLVYQNDFEQKAFAEIKDNHPDHAIALLMAINPQTDEAAYQKAQQKINQIIASLDAEEVAGKKVKKATKIIFEKVHSYLKLYQEQAHFDQIFTDGIYNCLTASALYAYVLQHYKIPFEIIEIPSHIFVLVDPAEESLVLETTDPKNGIAKLDKNKIVQLLKEQKMVSEQQTIGKSTEEIYDAYFQNEQKKINMTQVAGLAYFNLALEHFNNSLYAQAVRQVEKSICLYPNENSELLRLGSLVLWAEKVNMNQIESFEPLFILLDYPEKKLAAQSEIVAQYEGIAKMYLLQKYSATKYEEIHQHFLKNLLAHNQSTFDIDYLHHVYYGLHYTLKNNNSKSVMHLDSAYQLEPESLQLQSLMSETIQNSLFERQNAYSVYNSNTDSLLLRYPFLSENEKVMEIHAFRICKTLTQSFEDFKPEEGFAALEQLQPKINALKPSLIYNKCIEQIYGSIQRYYVRKDEYTQCQFWVEKGLALYPDSFVLNQYLTTIKEHIQKYGANPYPNPKKKN